MNNQNLYKFRVDGYCYVFEAADEREAMKKANEELAGDGEGLLGRDFYAWFPAGENAWYAGRGVWD